MAKRKKKKATDNKRFQQAWKKSRTKSRTLKFGNQLVSPLWDLEKHGISYSMISKFLECRERFRLANVEGWTETALSVPLEFGNIFHECLEAQARGKSWQRATSVYYKKQSANYTPSEREALATVCGVVEVTYPRYMAHWNNDANKVYFYREQEFRVTRKLPSGRTIILVGKMDAAFNYKTSPTQDWLQENKTKGQIDDHLIQNTLDQDLQTMIYSYAMGQLRGKKPVGVLYNVIRRTQLKRKVNETLSDFLARIAEDIDKRPDFYFKRWEHPLTDNHVEEQLSKNLDPILEQIYDWWESIKRSPFDPWVNEDGEQNLLHWARPFGVYDPMGVKGYGSFFQLFTQGSYHGLTQRDRAFMELDDANTPDEGEI